MTQQSLAVDATAPHIAGTQYAGENRVAVRWFDTNADEACGIDEYGLFARVSGGEYALAADLRDTTDRMWFGRIPGLSETTPVTLQIRRKISTDLSVYCSTPEENSSTIDITDVDNPPSMTTSGDVTLTPSQAMALDNGTLVIEDWASDITDNDGETQMLLDNAVYSSGGTLAWLNDSFGSPATYLSLSNRTRANSRYQPDTLNVLQFCNVTKQTGEYLTDSWVGACTDEVPFIVSVDTSMAGYENYPHFDVPQSLHVGTDYSLKGYEEWAHNISRGANATPSSDLYFHTLWVTNSDLFDVAPWLSTPSGSLRFKFKNGVSGTSRVYFVLGDWDSNSPENIARFVDGGIGNEYAGYGGTRDLPPDHSRIRFVDISVGDQGAAPMLSNGASGVDLTKGDDIAAPTSAGGSIGYWVLCLIALRLRFNRTRVTV